MDGLWGGGEGGECEMLSVQGVSGKRVEFLSMSGIPDRISVSNSEQCITVYVTAFMGNQVPSARNCSCPRKEYCGEVKPEMFP